MSVPALNLRTLPAALEPRHKESLETLTRSLDSNGLWWLSGYAAGLAQARADTTANVPAVQAESAASTKFTVVYGSQTGNAKRLAEALREQLEQTGLNVELLRADSYPSNRLKDERYLIIVISTQGEGDPPDDARGLVEFIESRRAPKLESLNFSVFGLGDSSYPLFCEIGKRLDLRLEQLGASRWLPRIDADLDIDSVATPWLQQTLKRASEVLRSMPHSATVTPLHRSLATPSRYTRETPFLAEVLAQQRISGRGSSKDIHHIELSLQGSGLSYQPGDALGVWPRNPAQLVDAIIALLQLDGDEFISDHGRGLALREWLTSRLEITRLSRAFLLAHLELSGTDAARALLDGSRSAELSALVGDLQLIDVLKRWPAPWSAPALVAELRPLTPRLYSIASSQKAVGEEVHLTVARLKFERDGELRWGTASNTLADAAEGSRLAVFIEENSRFRLPHNGDSDVIMIGPGTGVAPFRGFVQQRAAAGACGRNWLLFGNPHARSDFLYQSEWQAALRAGQLHRLDLAFSRDQVRSLHGPQPAAQKTYVQHRLREHGAEVYAWLRDGAHLYVCGDAKAMARDVHQTLIDILAEHGDQPREAAETELNDLLASGRYARDVY